MPHGCSLCRRSRHCHQASMSRYTLPYVRACMHARWHAAGRIVRACSHVRVCVQARGNQPYWHKPRAHARSCTDMRGGALLSNTSKARNQPAQRQQAIKQTKPQPAKITREKETHKKAPPSCMPPVPYIMNFCRCVLSTAPSVQACAHTRLCVRARARGRRSALSVGTV